MPVRDMRFRFVWGMRGAGRRVNRVGGYHVGDGLRAVKCVPDGLYRVREGVKVCVFLDM